MSATETVPETGESTMQPKKAPEVKPSGFLIAISDARRFRNILSAVTPLVNEADFTFSPEEVKMRSMDPSHVAMVNLQLGKAMFSEYSCPNPLTVRINIEDLVKKLRNAGEEPLNLTYDPATRKITAILKGKWRTTLTIPTLDPGDDEIPQPKISFNAKMKLTSATLKAVLDQISTVTDNLRLTATQENVICEGLGELSQVKVEIEKGSEPLLELEVKAPVTSTYNMNYLDSISKGIASLSEIVTIEFAKDMPIKIVSDLAEDCTVTYYLAPRIESD